MDMFACSNTTIPNAVNIPFVNLLKMIILILFSIFLFSVYSAYVIPKILFSVDFFS